MSMTDLAFKSGYDRNKLVAYRNASHNMSVLALVDLAEVFGYEIRLVPKEKSK